MLGKKLAIDLGTTTLRVFVKGEGHAGTEPSLAAVAPDGMVLGVGDGAIAAALAGPAGVRLVSPLADGRVADVAALEALVTHVVLRATGRQRIFKPDVMLTVSSAFPPDDRRTLLEAAMRAGARTVYLLDAPVAAAIGAGQAIESPRGRLVVDCGGGRMELAVLALEGAAVRRTVPEASGHALTARLARHVLAGHGVVVTEGTAEELKRELAAAVPLHEERLLRVLGKAEDGADRELSVSSTEVHGVVQAWLEPAEAALRSLLAETPPALLEDVTTDGGILTGAGAVLRGLDRRLSAVAGFPLRVAAQPEGCALRGCAAALDNLDLLKRNLLYIR